MATIEGSIRGWQWVLSEFTRHLTEVRAEAARLLGPDRGE